MFRVICIDPSLRSTGVYTSDDLSFCIKTKGEHSSSLLFIHEVLNEHLSSTMYDLAVVEDYAYNVKNSSSITALGEVRGVVLMTLNAWSIPIVDMNIQIWKSLTLGINKKDKKHYLEWVKRLYNKVFETTDEADAYMMYKALCLIMSGKALTKGAKGLLEKIDLKLEGK